MFKSGLVSITFRELSPEVIIDHVAEAGLDAVEWGGDIHVPSGEVGIARSVGRRTKVAGLDVAAYGSYYHLDEGIETFKPVVATAYELGAPTIRVWAGRLRSSEASEDYRRRIVENVLACSEQLNGTEMTLSFEYHNHTLTDDGDSARRLLEACDHPRVRTYWQPDVHLSSDEQGLSLKKVEHALTNLHVFRWSLENEEVIRQPLIHGLDDWVEMISAIDKSALPQLPHYAMIEFVKDNDIRQFYEDGKALKEILGICG